GGEDTGNEPTLRGGGAVAAGDAKAHVGVCLVRLETAPAGGAEVPARVAPRPAARTPELALVRSLRVLFRTAGGVPVVQPVAAPLPDVAVHVVQPPGVGSVGADGRRAAEIRALGRVAVGLVAEKVGVVGRQVLPAVKRQGNERTGAAGIFPLRLGRQTVD